MHASNQFKPNLFCPHGDEQKIYITFLIKKGGGEIPRINIIGAGWDRIKFMTSLTISQDQQPARARQTFPRQRSMSYDTVSSFIPSR